MANNNVLKISSDKLGEIVSKIVENRMMTIAGATGRGESPYSLYKPPVTNPGRGEAVYGTEKDGQRYFEFLKAMMIDPANNIRKTGGPLGNDDSYGRGNVPGHPDWKISAGPQLPNFKPMGRVIKGVREGVLPLKDTKIKQNLQIGPQANIKDSMQRENVGGTLRDMMLPLLIKEYGKDGSGGYKNPSKLLSGMKKLAKNLPANNIRRLRDSGHKTDYTGGFRLGDDGQLIPQLGITKADASNNIRRLSESGHQTVFDPITGQLKIVKTI